MTITLARARRALLGVSEKEIIAFKRGDSAKWRHLEEALRAAVGGYHAVLDGGGIDDIVARLDRFPVHMNGYAYEGAAMGLTGMDCWLPGKSRFREFLAGRGSAHIYMVHIGAGEALARMRRRPEPFLDRLDDPVERWLVMDGYGFHLGFFARRRYVDRQDVPRHLSPYARRVFDQGVGRSIWFTSGADVDRVAADVAAFSPDRQPDLWLGIGIGSSYAGGVDRQELERLRDASGPHLAWVATGAAFAAKGRHRAGNPAPNTELACEVLCDTSSLGAAEMVDEALASLPARYEQPGCELVQDHMVEAFAASSKPADSGSARWT
jgi:enediyne biosynthesis protein E3